MRLWLHLDPSVLPCVFPVLCVQLQVLPVLSMWRWVLPGLLMQMQFLLISPMQTQDLCPIRVAVDHCLWCHKSFWVVRVAAGPFGTARAVVGPSGPVCVAIGLFWFVHVAVGPSGPVSEVVDISGTVCAVAGLS